MKSIRSVYKIGHGPSSSHTVGPFRAAQEFGRRYPDADAYRATLYGSLAFTGEGHGTQKSIVSGLPGTEVVSCLDVPETELPHPNTMLFEAFRDGQLIGRNRILSIGGGSIRFEGEESGEDREVYPQQNFTQFLTLCRERNIPLIQLMYRYEDISLRDYLREIWQAMQDSVRRGLRADGVLPGGLGVARKAKLLFEKRCYNESADVAMNRVIAAYAYAVSEENADEGLVVTAPTCGSCGVLPAVMYYMQYDRGFPEEEILDALAVGALVGNVIRTNASISGAECGCQAEIGSACSMTAAALATLYGLNIDQIEYAAEMSLEHHLGMTCDPVCGLVQIPCIERNAYAAAQALDANIYASFTDGHHRVSFDKVVKVMKQTGKDLPSLYKETSEGGLAKNY